MNGTYLAYFIHIISLGKSHHEEWFDSQPSTSSTSSSDLDMESNMAYQKKKNNDKITDDNFHEHHATQ